MSLSFFIFYISSWVNNLSILFHLCVAFIRCMSLLQTFITGFIFKPTVIDIMPFFVTIIAFFISVQWTRFCNMPFTLTFKTYDSFFSFYPFKRFLFYILLLCKISII